MPVLNLSNTKSEYENLPEGRYTVSVVEAEEKVGNDSGKPYLWLQLAVTGDDDNYANRRLFVNMTYDEEKAFMLVQFLKAIGYTDDELQEVSIDENFLKEIIGQEIGVQVKIDPARGEYAAKNSIKKIFPVGE